MAMHRTKRRAGILVLRKLGMRFCRTRLLSRGTHMGMRMGMALDFRCESLLKEVAVDIRVLKRLS